MFFSANHFLFSLLVGGAVHALSECTPKQISSFFKAPIGQQCDSKSIWCSFGNSAKTCARQSNGQCACTDDPSSEPGFYCIGRPYPPFSCEISAPTNWTAGAACLPGDKPIILNSGECIADPAGTSKSKLPVWAIALIACGSVVGCVLLLCLCAGCSRASASSSSSYSYSSGSSYSYSSPAPVSSYTPPTPAPAGSGRQAEYEKAVAFYNEKVRIYNRAVQDQQQLSVRSVSVPVYKMIGTDYGAVARADAQNARLANDVFIAKDRLDAAKQAMERAKARLYN